MQAHYMDKDGEEVRGWLAWGEVFVVAVWEGQDVACSVLLHMSMTSPPHHTILHHTTPHHTTPHHTTPHA
jgi:hypothetical protein